MFLLTSTIHLSSRWHSQRLVGSLSGFLSQSLFIPLIAVRTLQEMVGGGFLSRTHYPALDPTLQMYKVS